LRVSFFLGGEDVADVGVEGLAEDEFVFFVSFVIQKLVI
tara:strand:+ start:28 stop:144 length:117 start_codon:yes stop_codon:yes gene_type:complete